MRLGMSLARVVYEYRDLDHLISGLGVLSSLALVRRVGRGRECWAARSIK